MPVTGNRHEPNRSIRNGSLTTRGAWIFGLGACGMVVVLGIAAFIALAVG